MNSIQRNSINPDEPFRKWFEKIYNESFEGLFRYAFSITKNKQMAEDVVSEVFLNIWKKKGDYQDIREINSYLIVSVKHLSIRMVSKDPSRYSYIAYDESLQVSDSVDPENLLMGKELEKIIEEVTSGLPHQCQLVYEMSKHKGIGNQKIADELGISKKTVESHLYHVVRLLKDRLTSHFIKEEKNTDFFLRKVISTIFMMTTIFPFFC